ncbi:hypothetical protein NIES4075_03730 [Tolypothrix sp. NIES-4075]|uniref:DUF3122 domain-containing protein n=1 Tax=Tolypothrix sp. NIES-4075 TaxID=2005459 RepID=UPI000B5C601A|nr:DUF3122 domain-containing protein [Tolypothrix sp. NIES-4075]GAX39417.1 hypothetical protein NIES4075_03730 [Tolypothrix sp. NIES-4075]
MDINKQNVGRAEAVKKRTLRAEALTTKYILRLILCIYLTLCSGIFFADSAFALLRQHHDAPGVLRYHSQVSIKDDFGYTWQVVLFKLFPPGKAVEFNLRLVGFPGVFELAHPRNLEIVTAKNKLLSASDVYAEKSPSPNVGDYNLTDVLFKLITTDSLKLYVPLSGEQRLVLQIPASVVTEWQWLVTDFNS